MLSPPAEPCDRGRTQTLIYTLQAEHVEMKGIVNAFSSGLGQLGEVRSAKPSHGIGNHPTAPPPPPPPVDIVAP